MELKAILRDIIANNPETAVPLPRGLMFQFHPGSTENPLNRLLVYRRNIAPSLKEFTIVRRDLEEVVGKPVVLLKKDMEYLASDGEWRYGKVFTWPSDARQEKLL